MSSSLAEAIRRARRTCELTQGQLGMRIGLRGRAIYRWERDLSVPTKRNQQALVAAIGSVNHEAAAKLAAAMAGEGVQVSALAASASLSTEVDHNIERAVFAMADELDLAPRRVRASLARLFKRLRDANTTLDAAHQQLDAWNKQTQALSQSDALGGDHDH
jgi:DNA-binding XRE family transcriptional regulator